MTRQAVSYLRPHSQHSGLSPCDWVKRVDHHKDTIFWLGTIATILSFYYVVSVYSVNLPIHDDYSAVLKFVVRWRETPALYLLFERQSEHWIVFTRLVVLLSSTLFGEVNFGALQWFGALGFIPIFMLIARRPISSSNSAMALLVLALWLFRQQDRKLIFYAMASIMHVWGLALSAGYLFFAMRGGWMSTVAAAVLLWLALVANTNTILLAPIAVLFLVLRGRRQMALIHAAIALPPLILFVITMNTGKPGNLSFVIDNPLLFLKFLLGLLGGSFNRSVFGSALMSYLFGAALGAAALWYLFRAKSHADDFAKPLVVFCLLTCVLIALGRTRTYAGDIDGTLSDGRYVVYSLVAAGVLLHRVTLACHSSACRAALPAVVSLLLMLLVSSFIHQIPRQNHAWEVMTTRFGRWAEDMTKKFPGHRNQHYREYLVDAICRGLYRRDLSERCQESARP